MTAPLVTGWGEAHAGWLLSYQEARARLDACADNDPDHDALCSQVNISEAMILREPAASPEAVLAKLFTAARISADGGEPPSELMQALVTEAESAFGFGAQVADAKP